jgi:hypothetical protein
MTIPAIMDLAGLWRDTLRDYTPLTSYCTGTMGKALSIYVGLDPKDPPDISDCPLIIIVPSGTRPGRMESDNTYGIELHMGINDGTFSDWQSKNVAAEMRGLYRMDTMWGHIQDALSAIAASKNLTDDVIQYSLNTEAFPLIQAQAIIESRLPNTIGVSITL